MNCGDSGNMASNKKLAMLIIEHNVSIAKNIPDIRLTLKYREIVTDRE